MDSSSQQPSYAPLRTDADVVDSLDSIVVTPSTLIHQERSSSEFKINLFDIGDLNSCLYSYLCTSCALAESRTFLDESSCIFNFFFTPITSYRWMVRSAYGIGNKEDFLEDCVFSAFCPCCVVNQLYQTTSTYRNPSPADGGRSKNIYPWVATEAISRFEKSNLCMKFLTSLICMPCAIGESLQKSIGMPFMLGCFCGGGICFAHNVIRYQYRLKNESKIDNAEDECIMYLSLCGCNFLASLCAPIAQCVPCFNCFAYATYVLRISVETEQRSRLIQSSNNSNSSSNNNHVTSGGGYLVGYQPSYITEPAYYTTTNNTTTNNTTAATSAAYEMTTSAVTVPVTATVVRATTRDELKNE